MIHIKTQEVFISGQDDIYIINDSSIKDWLVFCITYEFLCMIYGGNKLIRHFRKKNLGIRQVLWGFSLQDITYFSYVSVT